MQTTYRSQSPDFSHPEFYQQKASQLRLQNQLLRRQLEQVPTRVYINQSPQEEPTFRRDHPISQTYQLISNRNVPHYTLERGVFPDTANLSSFERIRQSPQNHQIRRVRYETVKPNSSDWIEKRSYVNNVDEEVIQLQTRAFKLQRQAMKLSSYIKEDLRDFVQDSNFHRQCDYKQKYLRSITTRPKFFRFNC